MVICLGSIVGSVVWVGQWGPLGETGCRLPAERKPAPSLPAVEFALSRVSQWPQRPRLLTRDDGTVTGAQPEAGGASQQGNNGDTFAQPHPGAPPFPPCSPSLPLLRVSTGSTEGLAWARGPVGGDRLLTRSGRGWRDSLLAGGRRPPLAPGHMAAPTRHLASSEQVSLLGPARQRPRALSPDWANDISPPFRSESPQRRGQMLHGVSLGGGAMGESCPSHPMEQLEAVVPAPALRGRAEAGP